MSDVALSAVDLFVADAQGARDTKIHHLGGGVMMNGNKFGRYGLGESPIGCSDE